MQTSISLFIKPGDKPSYRMGGVNGSMPILELEELSDLQVYVGGHDLELADSYLTALVQTAQDLQEKVRLAMQEKAVGLR